MGRSSEKLPRPPFPNTEADQLQAVERLPILHPEPIGAEVQLHVRQLAGRIPFVVRYECDCHLKLL
jgi:hypothetical protein